MWKTQEQEIQLFMLIKIEFSLSAYVWLHLDYEGHLIGNAGLSLDSLNIYFNVTSSNHTDTF